MENNPENNQQISKNKEEISAESADSFESRKPADESFKTSPRKHRLSWETPLDEQMLDSNRLSARDEEGD